MSHLPRFIERTAERAGPAASTATAVDVLADTLAGADVAKRRARPSSGSSRQYESAHKHLDVPWHGEVGRGAVLCTCDALRVQPRNSAGSECDKWLSVTVTVTVTEEPRGLHESKPSRAGGGVQWEDVHVT